MPKYERLVRIEKCFNTFLSSIIYYFYNFLIIYRINKNFPNIKFKKIVVNFKENKIRLYFKSIADRKEIDKSLNIISTVLPYNLICTRSYYAKNENSIIIEFEDISKPRKIYVDNEYDFFDEIKKLPYESFNIDRKITISLENAVHLLVAGGTGSGKTYFVNGLILQSLIHGYDVTILDIKKTYYQFDKVADVVYSQEDILQSMRELENELYERQKRMRKHLEVDGNLLACQCGIHNHLIVVEEYIALQSILDKKSGKEFESILTNIIVLGRQMGMHVIIVTQLALASTISSNIRSNMTKIVLKCNDESVLKTSFGLSTSTKFIKNYKTGEGLISLDTEIYDFESTTYLVPIGKILGLIKRE